MTTPVYTADDYRSALQALLPRGRAWPRDPDSIQYKVANGLSAVLGKVSSDALQLIRDAFPGTAYAMLPEWESSVGLPDPVLGQLPTVAQRRGAVLARLGGVGGQSVPYFVTFATNLGYSISVKEYAPARIGIARAGSPIYGPAWAYAWSINAPLFTTFQARAGSAAVGEPIKTWSNAPLQAELTEVAPAHTTLVFNYS